MAELKSVEIFGVGTWNQFKFVQEDLAEIVKNTKALMTKGSLKPKLKLGHSETQILDQSDGQPALGLAVNFQLKDDKITADFKNMPDILFESIEKTRFTSVSVEMDHIKEFGWFITAVSLLGADLPAVKTLDDLQAFLIDAIKDSSKVDTASLRFSEPHFTNPSEIGGKKMTDAEKIALAEAQALVKKNAELEVAIAGFKASEEANIANAEKAAKFAEIEKELEKFRAAETERSFNEKKEEVLKTYREDSKAGKLAPAIVDKVAAFLDGQKATFKDGDVLTLTPELALEVGKAYSDTLDKGESSHDQGDGDGGETPDIILERENAKLRAASPGMTWEQADEMVMLTQPKIYKDYFNWSNNIAQGGA